MPLALVRIDDRLIHGQVVEGWAPRVQATHLVVASDQAAADPVQRALLSLAVPAHLRISCCSIQEAARCSRVGEWDADRVLLLFANANDAALWVEAGGTCPSINVGGLHYAPAKTQVSTALFLNHEDLRVFQQLQRKGIRLEVRALPLDPPLDFWELLAQTVPHLQP